MGCHRQRNHRARLKVRMPVTFSTTLADLISQQALVEIFELGDHCQREIKFSSRNLCKLTFGAGAGVEFSFRLEL